MCTAFLITPSAFFFLMENQVSYPTQMPSQIIVARKSRSKAKGRLWIKTNETLMIDFQECNSAPPTEAPPVVTWPWQYLFSFIQEIVIEHRI